MRFAQAILERFHADGMVNPGAGDKPNQVVPRLRMRASISPSEGKTHEGAGDAPCLPKPTSPRLRNGEPTNRNGPVITSGITRRVPIFVRVALKDVGSRDM